MKLLVGKYRDKVIDNVDPLFMARLLVEVPSMTSLEASWAMPCSPYAGIEQGFCFLPPIGAHVWVEFEGGDPMHPVWAGCFWSEGELPPVLVDPYFKILRTPGTTLLINDTPGTGGLYLEVAAPAVEVPVSITIDPAGMQIMTSEAVVLITPETISVTLPPTTLTLSEAGVVLETEAIDVTAEATINVTSPETSVEGNVSIEGAVEIQGAVEITGDVNVVGAVEIEGDVNVLGAVEIEGDVNVVGAVEVEGDVNILGAFEVEGDVTVLGLADVIGDFAVVGAVEVAGAVVAPSFIGTLVGAIA